MKVFRTLFGGEPSSVRKNCVLTPFISRDILKGFKMEKLTNGALFSIGDNGLFSLIVTGMGALFVGDVVLHLEKTTCENLILFGSCGALPETGFYTGILTVIEKAFSQDSFVHMLIGKKAEDVFYPNEDLLKSFLAFQEEFSLKKATCLTVGSLKLEEEYLDTMHNTPVDVVDMETSAFYLAAQYTKKRAISVLFVTDILKTFPYYESIKKENRTILRNITAKASNTLLSLMKNVCLILLIKFLVV